MMHNNEAATKEVAGAVTSVWWDINTCPVPFGFDAARVGPSIKQTLESLGYYGPLTITAVGLLSDAPESHLRAACSTGMALNYAAYGLHGIGVSILQWTRSNRPPANIMLISGELVFDRFLAKLYMRGYNILRAYPFSPQPTEWKSLLTDAIDSGETTGESPWVCTECNDLEGQGFESFIMHIKSQEHMVPQFGVEAVAGGEAVAGVEAEAFGCQAD